MKKISLLSLTIIINITKLIGISTTMLHRTVTTLPILYRIDDRDLFISRDYQQNIRQIELAQREAEREVQRSNSIRQLKQEILNEADDEKKKKLIYQFNYRFGQNQN